VDHNNLLVAREVSDMFNGVTNAGVLEAGSGPLLSFSTVFLSPQEKHTLALASASAKVILIL
jgi:hypothetical protein